MADCAALPGDMLSRFAAIIGPRHVLTEPDAQAPYLEERRGLFRSETPAVLRPASTEEAAAVVRLCAEEGVAIVPQGGNTGLVGGGVARGEIIISLGRMSRVRAIAPDDFTMTVEAGAVLADLQRVAEEHDRLFPLSLGAEGSCQIGGNLSTNAGGTAVLRYGNARDLCLGLEVVLPDGRVWDGLRRLRKDNTGYALKQLFIGAEGTLGLITAAVLKLFPRPAREETALVGVATPADALALLTVMRAASGDALTAFELMARQGVVFATRHIPGVGDPLAEPHAYYVLIELALGGSMRVTGPIMEHALGRAFETGLVEDAVIAASQAQRAALWRLREAMVEAQRLAGASIKNDVSVPVSKAPAFITEAGAAVEAACPGIRPIPFGHLGDGNIHFNLTQPEGADGERFLARWDELTGLVSDIAVGLGGSFSAEHGIGLLKSAELARRRPEVEVAMMRAIKRALDPQGLMNPGKVVPGA